MKRIAAGILAALMMTTVAPRAQEAERLFKTAMNAELVDGNLRAAIEQYERVAKGANRPLAAQALLRMAECYEKLGEAQSRAVYERLVRDFADQSQPVSTARARLGGAATAGKHGMTSRRVWAPANDASFGTVSADGQLLSYTDWSNGNLFVHDFRTGRDRRLTTKAAGAASREFAEESAMSRDGRSVAYSWWSTDAGTYELRVVSLSGDGVSTPRTLVSNADIGWLMPTDWSPDGRWIAALLSRVDRTTQLALVSAVDGSLHVLKSNRWQGAAEVFFSPDGKYLAFDSPTGDAQEPSDVYVMEVDLSGKVPAPVREVAAVVSPSHEIVMGWSPDGTQLLFSSDRGGTTGLWAQPMSGGRPQGSPRSIKSEIPGEPLGMTAAGTLLLRASVSEQDVYVAGVNLDTGKVTEAPMSPVIRYVGTNRSPAWSRDGRSLAYVSLRGRSGANQKAVLVIYSLDSQQTRELDVPDLNYFQFPQWAPDGRSLIARGAHVNGKGGIHRIDARTGAVETIAEPGVGAQVSPDGRRLYYRSFANEIMERDLATGKSRVLIKRERLGLPKLSPDGATIAVETEDVSRQVALLLVVRVTDGEPREVAKLRTPQRDGGLSWTPDGRRVVVRVPPVGTSFSGSDTRDELQIIPIDGGAAVPLAVPGPLGNSFEGVAINPDGQRIAYVAGERRGAVEVLENFLPQASVHR